MPTTTAATAAVSTGTAALILFKANAKEYAKKNPRRTAVALAVAATSLTAVGAYAIRCYNDRHPFWDDGLHAPSVMEDGTPVGLELKFVGSKQHNHPTLEDIPALISDMRMTFEAGVSLPLSKRREQLRALQQMLQENEEQICEALLEDLGRPLVEAQYYDIWLPLAEIRKLIGHLEEWTAPAPVNAFSLTAFPSSQRIIKEPYGVALIIGTWNYPFLLSLTPLGGALAAGNTVVLKPSNLAPASAKLQASLIRKYLDPQIVTVVGPEIEGDRHTTEALLQQKFDVAFFTGSPQVGRIVAEACGKSLTRCTLELGGKNPVIVAADADIKRAAKQVVWGRMMNCGQQCISPDYVLCSEKVIAEFLLECRRSVAELYPDPHTPGRMGRIVGDKQMERLVGLLQSHGGEVVCGGEYDVAMRYIAPTVLHVSLDSSVMQEELFGPILPVCEVSDAEAAAAFVRRRSKPLALYLFSSNRATQDRILKTTSAGGVTINGTLWHVAHAGLPFGGVGASGMGAYHGESTIQCFQHNKPCLEKLALPFDYGSILSDPFFLYPPWTSLKGKLIRMVASLS